MTSFQEITWQTPIKQTPWSNNWAKKIGLFVLTFFNFKIYKNKIKCCRGFLEIWYRSTIDTIHIHERCHIYCTIIIGTVYILRIARCYCLFFSFSSMLLMMIMSWTVSMGRLKGWWMKTIELCVHFFLCCLLYMTDSPWLPKRKVFGTKFIWSRRWLFSTTATFFFCIHNKS